jgi:hypothetical protein
MVAVWKHDRITECGRLDNKKREGGWDAVSGAVADQTNSRWTARSLRTLERVLDRANPVHTRRNRLYDEAGDMIETYEHKGDFKEW